MTEAALCGLLQDLVVRLRSLRGNNNLVAVKSSEIMGTFVRVWQAGVVEPSRLLWNETLAQELKELGFHHTVPLLDLMDDAADNSNFDSLVLRTFHVQLSILQGVVSVSGGMCMVSAILGPMLNTMYYKVLAPSGLDRSGEIIRTLTEIGFGWR